MAGTRALAFLGGVVAVSGMSPSTMRLSRAVLARGMLLAAATPPPSPLAVPPAHLALELGRRTFGRTLTTAAIGSLLVPPSALAALGAAAPTLAAAAMKTRVFEVRTPALELRQFRALLLPNGLRVLLASDKEAERAAAALCVRAGYFDDPAGVPGLAHFCEHMLFLGTSKYPAEDSFDSFINSAAGANNAYTASESTCYYFDVDAPRLPDALDRFAQFFVKNGPLFTPAATSRELNAIESEHSKNLQQDSWREQELLKLVSRRLSQQTEKSVVSEPHPYAKFGTGNKRTLSEEPERGGVDVRAELLKYHSSKYTAERMGLVVVGEKSLDELQRLVEGSFSAVPTSPSGVPSDAPSPILRGAAWGDAGGAGDPARNSWEPGMPAPGPFGPLAAIGLPPIAIRGGPPVLCYVPVSANTQSLSLTWAVPTPVDSLVKPDYLLRQLLTRRDEGSLWSVLRARGLATDVGAYAVDEFGQCALFRVAIELSDKGVSCWREVADLAHAHLGWLRATAADSKAAATFFADAERLASIGFEYAERSEPSSISESLSAQLFDYAPVDYFAGPATLRAGRASALAVPALLQALAPESVVTLLGAKKIAEGAKLVEPIYGTHYTELDGKSLLASTLKASKRAASLVNNGGGPKLNFFYPPKNEYLPSGAALVLKTADNEKVLSARFARSSAFSSLLPVEFKPRSPEGPWVVSESPGLRVHFAPLPRFNRPFASVRALLGSSLVRARGAEGGVSAKLWAALLSERLERSLNSAFTAGYALEVGAADAGLVLGIRGWGYDEATLGALSDALLAAVQRPLFEPQQSVGLAEAAKNALAEKEAFQRLKESFVREAAAFDSAAPLQQGGYALRLLLDQGSYPIEQTRKAINAITEDSLKAFALEFVSGPIYCEALLAGNANSADASQLAVRLTSALSAGGGAILRREDVPRRLVSKLPLTSEQAPAGVLLRTQGRNADEVNGAVQVYWQIGGRRARSSTSRSGDGSTVASDRHAALEVLAQLLEQPAYAQLRTREQLGYAVGAGLSEIDGAFGLYIAVQSAILPPAQVLGRIDAFVLSFGAELANTSSDRLASVVQSLARAKRERSKRLAQQAGRYWLEVARGEYLFARGEEEAKVCVCMCVCFGFNF